MPISFQCTKCGTAHNAPDNLAGRKIKCKGCGSVEQVPKSARQAPAKPAAQASRPSGGAKRGSAAPRAPAAPQAGLSPGQPAPDPFAADPFAAVAPLDPYAAAPDPFAAAGAAPMGMQPQGALTNAPFPPGLGAYAQPRSKGMSPAMQVMLIVGGLVGLGVVCLAGVAFWAMSGSGTEQPMAGVPDGTQQESPITSAEISPQSQPVDPLSSQSDSADRRPAPVDARPSVAARPPSSSGNLGGNRGSASGGNLSNYQPVARSGDGAAQTGSQRPPQTATRPTEGSDKPLDVPALNASVPADPLDPALAVEISSSRLVSIPVDAWAETHFPYFVSPFVAIAAHRNESVQVWDLRTQQPTSKFNPKVGTTASKGTLSIDGRYFAAIDFQGLVVTPTTGDDEPQTIKVSQPVHFVALTKDEVILIDQVRDPETRESDPLVHVYEAATGKELRHFGFDGKWIPQKTNLALSGGGRLLAGVVQRDRARFMQVLDTGSGKVLAESRLPNAAGLHPTGLAFSPDGRELTAMMSQSTSNLSRLLTWNLADGELALQFTLAHADYPWLQRYGAYAGPTVQAIAGGGWLLCGRGVVNREGVVTTELPEGSSAGRSIQRRAFSEDSFLLAAASGKDQVLTNQTKMIGSGQGNTTAQQAMTSSANADLAKAKKIALPSGTVKWDVQPDPAPAPKSGLGEKPTELKSIGDEALSYHFASPAVGIAAVYCMKEKTHQDIVAENNARAAQIQAASKRAADNARAGIPPDFNDYRDNTVIPTPPVWIDRYDLVSNEYLGRLNLASGSVMHDLSPNGEKALVQHGNDLQVWSLTDGKQLSQWAVPGLNSPTKTFNVCCLFSGDDHVMARVDGSRVARWHLPDCQALYVIEKLESRYGKTIERISPGGKYWMTVMQRTGGPALVGLFETATGQLKGVAAASTMGDEAVMCYESRFRPDGQQAGFVLSCGSANLRTILDMKTGRIFCEPGIHSKFFWAGDRHWYHSNGSLYDIAYRNKVWDYQESLGATALAEAPGGRLWFSAFAGGANSTRWLANAQVPNAGTLNQINALFAGKKPVLDRGSKVSLEVSADGPGLNQKVTAELTKKIRANGMEVAAGSPIRVVASAHVSGSSTKEYKKVGSGGGETFTVNITTVACEVKFFDASNKPIWEATAKVSSDPGLFVSGDISKQESSHWPKAEKWLLGVPMPTRIYAPPKPGTSAFDFPGVVDKSSSPALANNASSSPPANIGSGRRNPTTASGRPGLPINAAPAQQPASIAPTSQESRQRIAKAYAKVLEKQDWDKLRGISKLGRPLVNLQWALGTEVGAQTPNRDVDSFSRYAGRSILEGLASGKPGELAPPQPVVLGLGSRGKLLRGAREHWADLLLLADIDSKPIGLTTRVNTTITVRVIDVASGDQLWISEPLKQLNVNIGRQFADYVLKDLDKTFLLQPLSPPTTATVVSRTEALGKKEFLHPLAALAEIGYYRHTEALSDVEAGKLYGDILGAAEGIQYAEADAAKRAELIEKWLPGWIAEQ